MNKMMVSSSTWVFEVLDFNNDGFLSEMDMFQIMSDVQNRVFIEVFTQDFVKIIQCIIDKKKSWGTYNEAEYNYNKLMKKISTYRSTYKDLRANKGSDSDGSEEPRKSFFEFATAVLEPKFAKRKTEDIDISLNSHLKSQNSNDKKAKIGVEQTLNMKHSQSVSNRYKRWQNISDLLYDYWDKEMSNDRTSKNTQSVGFHFLFKTLADALIRIIQKVSLTFMGYSNKLMVIVV